MLIEGIVNSQEEYHAAMTRQAERFASSPRRKAVIEATRDMCIALDNTLFQTIYREQIGPDDIGQAMANITASVVMTFARKFGVEGADVLLALTVLRDAAAIIDRNDDERKVAMSANGTPN